jgi:hypothetical protein
LFNANDRAELDLMVEEGLIQTGGDAFMQAGYWVERPRKDGCEAAVVGFENDTDHGWCVDCYPPKAKSQPSQDERRRAAAKRLMEGVPMTQHTRRNALLTGFMAGARYEHKFILTLGNPARVDPEYQVVKGKPSGALQVDTKKLVGEDE